MPNRFFEPIIGSGFDAIAGQRQFWAGFNNSVEEANLRRAQAAQEAQNNYFSQASALAQRANDRDVALQMEAENRAQALDAQSRAEARRMYEFNTGMATERAKNLGTEQRYDEANAERKREFDLGLKTAKDQAAEELDNSGQSFAVSYAASKRQLAQADKAADVLQGENDTLLSMVAELQKKEDKSDTDISALAKANARLAELKKQLPKAITARQRVEQQHLSLTDNLTSRGFVPDEENGSLTHLGTGKSWSFSKAMDAAKRAVAVTPEGPTAVGAAIHPLPGPLQDRLTAGTGTNAPPNYFAPPTTGAVAVTQPVAPVALGESIQSQKAKWANGLAQVHPEWSRERIIAETERQFASMATGR